MSHDVPCDLVIAAPAPAKLGTLSTEIIGIRVPTGRSAATEV